MTVTRLTGELETVELVAIPRSEESKVLLSIQQQLTTVFGTKYPWIRIAKDKDGYSFKLRKQSKVEFSPALSNLLTVQTTVENPDETKQMEIPITFNEPQQSTTQDNMYYIKSDLITPKFVHNGQLDRVVDFININGFSNSIFEHYPLTLKYSRIEASLLESLTLSIYKASGEALYSDAIDLYFLCHIRPNASA